MSNPMTYDEYLAQQMQDPEYRAEWEALEPEFEVARAIIEGKPLTGFPLDLIAKAADVSLEEARIMQMGKKPQQSRTVRVSKAQARAAVH